MLHLRLLKIIKCWVSVYFCFRFRFSVENEITFSVVFSYGRLLSLKYIVQFSRSKTPFSHCWSSLQHCCTTAQPAIIFSIQLKMSIHVWCGYTDIN